MRGMHAKGFGISRILSVLLLVILLSSSLLAAGTISGTVTKNSVALPSAYIDVIDSGSGFFEVQSGPGGEYTIPGLAAGNADVYCYAPDGIKYIEHRVVNIPEGGTATANFDWSVGEVWGTVKKNGSILANAHIMLNDINNNWYDAYTNALGNYSISDVTAGAVGAYCFDTDGTQIGYKTGSVGRGILVEISFNTWFFGSIDAYVTRGGSAYQGARIEVHDAMGNWKQGYTGANGHCVLSNIAVGNADVYIYSSEGWLLNQQTAVVVQGVTTPVTFDWGAGTINVTVTRNGLPLENAYVELDETHFAYTSASGQCSIDSEAGDKIVSVYHDLAGSVDHGYRIEARPVSLLTGQTLDETFDWRCGTIQGTVTRYMVALEAASVGVDGRGYVATDASGQYTVDISTGAQTISFYSPDPQNVLMGNPYPLAILEGQTETLNWDWRPTLTSVSGTITTNTTWTADNSPYQVTGDIIVDSGVTLTIEPEVRVYFQAGTGMTVLGTLSAQGDAPDSIHFGSVGETSIPSSANPGDWKGILFSGSGSNSSAMDYCAIAYAGAGTDQTGIRVADDSVPTISNCSVTNTAGYPISVYCNSIRGKLTGNTGSGNTAGDGIQVRGGQVSASQTWSAQPLPYMVTGDVSVWWSSGQTGAPTLTIEPGCVLEFKSGCGLTAGRPDISTSSSYWGNLKAQGTAESPIRFTALSGAPGGWRGIFFTNYSDDAQCILDQCVIEYAGEIYNNIWVSNVSANVFCCAASPTIANSTIFGGSGDGLYCYAWATQAANPSVTGCTFSGNAKNGVYADDLSVPVVAGCTLSSNGLYAMSLYPNGVRGGSGNTGSGNTSGDGIQVRGGQVSTSQTWSAQPLPYMVTGDVSVWWSSGQTGAPTLTIEPGCVLEFKSGCGLTAGHPNNVSGNYWGNLKAQGTAESPIRFTALSGAAGGWRGIFFTNYSDDAQCILDQCVIEYAGEIYNNIWVSNVSANVFCCTASPTIANSTIFGGSGDGVYADSLSVPVVAGCTLSSNGLYAMSLYANGVCGGSGNTGSGNTAGDGIQVRGGQVSTSQTWSAQPLPYMVTGNVIVCWSSGQTGAPTLTIEPGCVLEFKSGCGLTAGHPNTTSGSYWGNLKAQGTAESPIRFTAISGAAGGWRGIFFTNYSDDAQCILDQCVIEYAGEIYNNSWLSNVSASIFCCAASPTIANSTIFGGSGDGLYCYAWSSLAANPSVTGCTFSGNAKNGVYADDPSRPTVDESRFTGNSTSAVNIKWDRLGDIGAVSGTDSILLRTGGIVTQNWTLKRKGLPYLLAGDTTIRGSSTGSGNGVTMIIEAGCTVKFSLGSKLLIGDAGYYGDLRTLGVSDNPVTLTSSSGAAGGWKGLRLSQYITATTEVRHTVIGCGGSDISYPASLYIQSSLPKITNCTITRGLVHGVVLSSSNAQLKNCIVAENAGLGVTGTSSSPTVTYCDIWGNEGGNYSGVTPGTGCFSANPLFIDSNQGDYRLTDPGSLCIDTGDPSMVDIIGSRIDVGAYSISGTPVASCTASGAKAAPDGATVRLEDKVVSAVYQNAFYIEEDDRSSGIRVTSTDPINQGDRVWVAGMMATQGGERYIPASQVKVLSSSNPVPKSLTLLGRDLGGGALGSAPAVGRGVAPNNVGLLVTSWGWVTAVVADGFYIDDGTKCEADEGRIGVKVATTGLAPGKTFTAPLVGRHVTVTGAVSCGDFSGTILPILRPRQQADMGYNRAILYSETFENGLGDWTAMPDSVLMSISGTGYVSPVSSALAGGAQAASMHRATGTVFPDRMYLSCWIYDTGGPGTSGKQYIHLRALDGTTVKDQFGAGIYGPVSTASYCVRTNAQSWWATSVARTVGWHKFQIEVLPYTGSGDVKFFIDGQPAGTGNRTVSWSINDIQLGASGVPGGIDAYYDDVEFGLTE